jgi:hypothetical protein
LDLASKYESLLGFIEKTSMKTDNRLRERELMKQKRDHEKAKKIGAQIAKGIFLGLICVPLIPFLPILYGQAYAKTAKSVKAARSARRKERQTLLAYLGL